MSAIEDEPVTAVLFACNMNSVRSPMAAGLVNHYFGNSITAFSAGVRQADEINGFSLGCMAELGIDITDHRPRTFADLGALNFDLVVSLTPEAHHQAVELTHTSPVEFEYWPTYDPTLEMGSRDRIMAAFRKVREGLLSRITTRLGTHKASNM
jgi:protein-tyrosine-phosphatase